MPRTIASPPVLVLLLTAAAVQAGVASCVPIGDAAQAPATAVSPRAAPGDRPNIVLVITDDQGYGDVGAHGNAFLRTPSLDRLARESVQFRSFLVSPVCSPTRASVMTGRYNYRTGVTDTYLGRSLMHADETTVAELLARAGYRTGIFGKWHLGDNHPMRAMDQGFQESLVLNGGGIGQPSDPPGGESYFDPLLRRNGQWVRTRGYVSDVLTDAAVDFMRRHRARPFFAYLAFNAPHTPLQAPRAEYARYRDLGLTPDVLAGPRHPFAQKVDPDVTAKIYAMVENIDSNVGRVLAALDDLQLDDRTLVIFMTDNGPQQHRYNGQLNGLKGSVWDGGIRVPFFVRWPPAGARHIVERPAAHIDVLPTLLDAARVPLPAGLRIDGRSLMPLVENGSAAWPDRRLFFQWHRGDVPERFRAFAVRAPRYKLVQPLGAGESRLPDSFDLRLFDMQADPAEAEDLAHSRKDVAEALRADYDAWFTDVTRERDYTDRGVARIHIGSREENPVRLTRQDWRGPGAGWTPTSIGYWEVDVRQSGTYEATLRFAPGAGERVVGFAAGGRPRSDRAPAGETTVVFRDVRLQRGQTRLEAWAEDGGRRIGVLDLVIRRVR